MTQRHDGQHQPRRPRSVHSGPQERHLDALVNRRIRRRRGARKFRQLCQMLASIYHYEYFGLLERLRDDYYYFSPEIAPHAAMDRAVIERCLCDLVQSLDQGAQGREFRRTAARRDRATRTAGAPCCGSRSRRRSTISATCVSTGAAITSSSSRSPNGSAAPAQGRGRSLRRRRAVRGDEAARPKSLRGGELRTLERRKIRPGSVLIKYFRNIASERPQCAVSQRARGHEHCDKLILGVPAIAGGIPILLNIYATITVLFLVIGFYLGFARPWRTRTSRGAGGAQRTGRARRLRHPAMDEISAPVAQVPEASSPTTSTSATSTTMPGSSTTSSARPRSRNARRRSSPIISCTRPPRR